MEELRDGERLDAIGFGDLQLIQKPSEFCYGVDAVLLADFAKLKKGVRAVDLGTGTGIIPLILSHKTDASEIWGVEIQEEPWKRAVRNAKCNGVEDRLRFILGDVKDIEKILGTGTFDAVLANPPYTPGTSGLQSENRAKMIARHETTATLEDFIFSAAKLLKERGEFYLVHRPSRLTDIFYCCRKHGLEPKEMRLVAPHEEEAPNIVLVRCVKGGGTELRFLSPLYIYDVKGEYTVELLRIYERESDWNTGQ